MRSPLRCVFFGTSEFAVPTLQSLAENSAVEIVAVVTRLDARVGRKRELQFSPVKQEAMRLKLRILQPASLRDFYSDFVGLSPDIGVVVSYGKIIPENFIDLPKFGILNVHASLLPRFRGASPIQHAILEGDTTTGVTVMKIDAGMDTGPILSQCNVPIAPDETTPTLSVKLAKEGAKLLLTTLPSYLSGVLKPHTQPREGVTYAKILKKEDGLLDFQQSAKKLERQVRALKPWPGSYFFVQGKKILVHDARVVPAPFSQNAKTGILCIDKDSLFIPTHDNSLALLKVQPEGKKPQEIRDFINGNRSLVGAKVDDTKNH
jgi:methionyl-tRNA formyltransferase